MVKLDFFQCFQASNILDFWHENPNVFRVYKLQFWVKIQIFGTKIQIFDTFFNKIFQNIFQYWRKNANISKSKVLSKLNFWTKISLFVQCGGQSTLGNGGDRCLRGYCPFSFSLQRYPKINIYFRKFIVAVTVKE